MITKGQIIKVSAGKFYVSADGKVYECSAKGVLKIKSDGIMTGDYVDFDGISVLKVYERKNALSRPNVSNIDLVNIVIGDPPRPDFIMLDKLIISCVARNAEIIITVNKNDIAPELIKEINDNYSKAVGKILSVSAKTGEGLEDLKQLLQGKLTAFAGQSAVGKTSLINAIYGLNLKTNVVSEKSQRGTHTTTVSEIYEKDGMRVIDTPGFSSVYNDIKAEELYNYYPDYIEAQKLCYYKACTHTAEPDCAVKEAVENGELSKERYLRYKQLYTELKSNRSFKYEKR